jgi:transposase
MLASQEAALRERDAQMLKLQETVDSQQAALASRAVEVEHLKLLIAKLRRMQFGRKSEKLDHQIEQFELRLEELEADEGAAPLEIPKRPRTAAEQTPRRPLPEHLPREIRTHLPESAGKCLECGGEMKTLGEDVAEQLEYVPASFRVLRHVRPKFACVATTSLRRMHRVVPSNAVSPVRGRRHTCWSRSSQTTYRCTGSR